MGGRFCSFPALSPVFSRSIAEDIAIALSGGVWLDLRWRWWRTPEPRGPSRAIERLFWQPDSWPRFGRKKGKKVHSAVNCRDQFFHTSEGFLWMLVERRHNDGWGWPAGVCGGRGGEHLGALNYRGPVLFSRTVVGLTVGWHQAQGIQNAPTVRHLGRIELAMRNARES